MLAVQSLVAAENGSSEWPYHDFDIGVREGKNLITCNAHVVNLKAIRSHNMSGGCIEHEVTA